MEELNLEDLDITPTRWGGFAQVGSSSEGIEKILIFTAGCGVSLQTHSRRSEVWKGLQGKGFLYLGKLSERGEQLYINDFPVFGEKILITKGTEVSIACGQAHMNVAATNEIFIVYEKWNYTDLHNPSNEADIHRFADPFTIESDHQVCTSWLQ